MSDYRPFLILQLRPEREAADNEFDAFLAKGGLLRSEVERVRLDCVEIESGLDLDRLSGVIVGGGPGCISDPADEKSAGEQRIEASILGLMPEITERDIPFLGCCYGIGILAHHLGAEVSKSRFSEGVGAVRCRVTRDGRLDPLLDGLPDAFLAFVGHKEALQMLPVDAVHLLSSGPCPFQMIRYKSNVYATQFHPEADSNVFALRIAIYKDRGYFPPEDATRLIEICRRADVRYPEAILKNFVARYRRPV